jgi:hypothetical protein
MAALLFKQHILLFLIMFMMLCMGCAGPHHGSLACAIGIVQASLQLC